MESLGLRIKDFLAAHSTLSLSTQGEDGPMAAPVFFAEDESLNLYFVSAAGTRHAQAIGRGARVAAAVYAETWEWQSIRGLQVEGVARPLEAAEREAALAAFAAKFPFVSGMAKLLESSTFYCIRPGWIRLIDNTQGFGHKEEWRRA